MLWHIDLQSLVGFSTMWWGPKRPKNKTKIQKALSGAGVCSLSVLGYGINTMAHHSRGPAIWKHMYPFLRRNPTNRIPRLAVWFANMWEKYRAANFSTVLTSHTSASSFCRFMLSRSVSAPALEAAARSLIWTATDILENTLNQYLTAT